MNRNYYQDQEIDCSCFDIHKKKILFIECQSNPISQKPNIKKNKYKLHSSFNINNTIKIPIKKSLKRKYDKNIIQQHKNTQLITKDVATQTNASHYKKQNRNRYQNNNKENRNNQQSQQNIIFQYFKHQSNNKESQQQQNNSIKQSSNYHQINIIECPSIHRTKQKSIQQINKSFKKKYVPFIAKQNQQNKAIKIIQPSDAQSQSKTIKKKPLLTQVKFRDLNPTLTSKFLQEKTSKQLQAPDNWKKIPIKAQSKLISSKKLKSMYPKQIQSFGEESISGFQSQVLERGRFTWAPDSSDKSAEKEEMTHTFHFRQTSSFSNVTDYQGSRISNQEIHLIKH